MSSALNSDLNRQAEGCSVRCSSRVLPCALSPSFARVCSGPKGRALSASDVSVLGRIPTNHKQQFWAVEALSSLVPVGSGPWVGQQTIAPTPLRYRQPTSLGSSCYEDHVLNSLLPCLIRRDLQLSNHTGMHTGSTRGLYRMR